MQKFFKKIKYKLGTIYRGLIGLYHNTFDKAPEINKHIDWEVVGQTVLGNKIRAYKIGDGAKKMLIVGGIHGNEVGTVKLSHHLLNWFFKNKKQFFNLTLFIIPCLNIDGYLRAIDNPDYAHRGKIGRFNDNAVDLNRNFPSANWQSNSVWKRGKKYAEFETTVFCGSEPASEPETKAIISFIEQNKIDHLIFLHNVGAEVFYDKNDDLAVNWAQTYKRFAGFKSGSNLDTSGSSFDWAVQNNIHYLSVEGSNRWGSDWSRQHQALQNIFQTLNQ